jgi:AcrR family transcriptional regulator
MEARQRPGTVVDDGESRSVKRERALVAFVESVERTGYSGTHVKDICAEVGISCREFYVWFEKKEQCYLHVFSAFGQRLISRANQAFARTDGLWETRLRAALETLARDLSANPRMVRYLLEHKHVASGGDALTRLVNDAEQVYMTDEARCCVPPLLASMVEQIVANVLIVPIRGYIEAGKLESLPEVVPWIVYYMTLNLFGPERAALQKPLPA